MSDSELEEDDFIQVLDIADPVVVETSVAVKRNWHMTVLNSCTAMCMD
jgi:hypothetical protein